MSEPGFRAEKDGLYVDMAAKKKLSAAPGAIYYWEAQNQETIRSCLGDQLP